MLELNYWEKGKKWMVSLKNFGKFKSFSPEAAEFLALNANDLRRCAAECRAKNGVVAAVVPVVTVPAPAPVAAPPISDNKLDQLADILVDRVTQRIMSKAGQ